MIDEVFDRLAMQYEWQWKERSHGEAPGGGGVMLYLCSARTTSMLDFHSPSSTPDSSVD